MHYNVIVATVVLILDYLYLKLMNNNSKRVSKYYEGIRKTGKYNCYDKVMYFIDEDKMTYQEDVKKARAIYSTSPLRIGNKDNCTLL